MEESGCSTISSASNKEADDSIPEEFTKEKKTRKAHFDSLCLVNKTERR